MIDNDWSRHGTTTSMRPLTVGLTLAVFGYRSTSLYQYFLRREFRDGTVGVTQ